MKNVLGAVLAATVMIVSVFAYAEQHVSAKNCEIFVDKIGARYGAYGCRLLTFYVKTLNFRLDGAIQEVGFRNRMKIVRFAGGPEVNIGWNNTILHSFFDAPNYFKLSLPCLFSDFGAMTVEGSFYVKTENGTFYWLRPEGAESFVIEEQVFSTVADLAINVNVSSESLVPTQRGNLPVFNPGNCY